MAQLFEGAHAFNQDISVAVSNNTKTFSMSVMLGLLRILVDGM